MTASAALEFGGRAFLVRPLFAATASRERVDRSTGRLGQMLGDGALSGPPLFEPLAGAAMSQKNFVSRS